MKNTEGVPRGRGLEAPESACLLSISAGGTNRSLRSEHAGSGVLCVMNSLRLPVKCAIYGLSSKPNWTSMSPLCENRRSEAFQTPYVLLSTREKVVCGVQKGGFTEAKTIKNQY